MPQPTVFIVEDNEDLRQTLVEGLEVEGYALHTADSGQALLDALDGGKRPDLFLLDILLPDTDGLSLIKQVRGYTNAPIIIVSGKGEMVDRVVGLEMGADDYISKPFRMRELSARVKAQLRRYNSMLEGGAGKQSEQKEGDDLLRIKFGSWILDRGTYDVYDASQNSAGLTIKEFRLLEALILAPQRVFSRDSLLSKIYNDDGDVFDRAIDVIVTRIRKKLGDDSENATYIKTVRGVGYMFVSKTEIL